MLVLPYTFPYILFFFLFSALTEITKFYQSIFEQKLGDFDIDAFRSLPEIYTHYS